MHIPIHMQRECMSSNICNLNTKHNSKTVNENKTEEENSERKEKRGKASSIIITHIIFIENVERKRHKIFSLRSRVVHV